MDPQKAGTEEMRAFQGFLFQALIEIRTIFDTD